MIPYILDQFLSAKTVEELKVGPKGIPGSKLSLELLLKGMTEVLNTGDYFVNAAELARKLELENGIETSINLIDEFIIRNKTM